MNPQMIQMNQQMGTGMPNNNIQMNNGQMNQMGPMGNQF